VDSSESNSEEQLSGTWQDFFDHSQSACTGSHAAPGSGKTWALCASSAFNNGVYDVAEFTEGTYESGNALAFCRGTGVGNLSDYSLGDGNWNDQAESNAWYSSGGSC
jgi:hypothetical protein